MSKRKRRAKAQPEINYVGVPLLLLKRPNVIFFAMRLEHALWEGDVAFDIFATDPADVDMLRGDHVGWAASLSEAVYFARHWVPGALNVFELLALEEAKQNVLLRD